MRERFSVLGSVWSMMGRMMIARPAVPAAYRAMANPATYKRTRYGRAYLKRRLRGCSVTR
jgi:hypothetical protein